MIHAELNKNNIPLNSGTAPAQIHIADGGEDGRVHWSGGVNQTDFLPSRYTVFQSKRSCPSAGELKKETWKKSTWTKPPPEINEALSQAISASGAYIVVTGDPIVGMKMDRRITALKTGIEDTGNDPAHLTSIKVYDSNELAKWASSHSAVALWVNEFLGDIHLHGFRAFDNWARDKDICEIPLQTTEDSRFTIKGNTARKLKKVNPSITDQNDLTSIRDVIERYFDSGGKSVRVVGPSGFGKTRFAHALFHEGNETFFDLLDVRQAVYAEYEDVKDRIISVCRDIANSGSRTTLIVDDCPDHDHNRMADIVNQETSNCLLISLNVETKTQGLDQNLVVELGAASDELIDGICGVISPDLRRQDSSFIRELAHGFPRMAIVAAKAVLDGDEALTSVDNLIERIVWGDAEKDAGALQTLQLLSLFTVVGVENQVENELEQVALFAGRTATSMFQDIARFSGRGVTTRLGDFAEVQSIPLAVRLANQWLQSNPSNALMRLFQAVDDDLQVRIVRRLRWLSWTEQVPGFATAIMKEMIPDYASFDTDFGSHLMDRFVHLDPDLTMDHLDSLIGHKSVDELIEFKAGRRSTIWALEKLVFRSETFEPAASLLLKLAAGENESFGNNATGQFVGLYQLHLSGTEATPTQKLALLDQGLSSDDIRIRKICIDALDKMLSTRNFSRGSGAERIGAANKLEDWSANTYGEIFDYYKQALLRISAIAESKEDCFCAQAKSIVASNARGLLNIASIKDDLESLALRLHDSFPEWHGILRAVSSWLYFDSDNAPEDYKLAIRNLYDELLPESDFEKICFFCSGWPSDLHAPDDTYVSDHDYNDRYSEQQIENIIAAMPNNAEHFEPLLNTFANRQFNSANIAISKIAQHVSSRAELLQALITKIKEHRTFDECISMVRSVIYEARTADTKECYDCLDIALKIPEFTPNSVQLINAAGVTDELMDTVMQLLQSGEIAPRTVTLLHGVSQEKAIELIELLVSLDGDGGWAALDFLSHLLHGAGELNAHQATLIQTVCIDHSLFESEPRDQMDSYHWKATVLKLLDSSFADEMLTAKLLDSIISLIDTPAHEIGLNIRTDTGELLQRLTSDYPDLVWDKYHETNSRSDSIKQQRLFDLFSDVRHEPERAGILNNIPQRIYLPWMLEDRSERIPFILSWIELFDTGNDDHKDWSSKFIAFIEDYVINAAEMYIVESRLTMGGWIGSYANKLEQVLEHVQSLSNLRNTHVANWARKFARSLSERIVEERHRDQNQSAGYRT